MPLKPRLSPQADVTVSVVSHGQEVLVKALLDDLSKYASERVGRIILTHNLGHAGASFYKENKPERCFEISNGRPRGFGANHNAAFALCETEWFAVINPDIRLNRDVFSDLIARAQPEDVVLAPSLLDPATGNVASNRGLLTPLEIVRRRMPGWHPRGAVVWLPGAFLLLRAAAFRHVGGFDERFFLYAEDFDLSARLRLAGGQLHYAPELQVTHAAQRSSHWRWRYLLWHATSLFRLWTAPNFWRYCALLHKDTIVRDAD